MDMAVMAIPTVFERYKKDVLSEIMISDKEYLSNYFNGKFHIDYDRAITETIFDKLSCILTGRQNHVLGYSAAYKMINQFPRAAFAIVDCAGHNLKIDNEALFNSFVKDWIWRIEMED